MFKKENKDFNKVIGQYGEDFATAYLTKNNYKILARNVKLSYREIDIIAKKGKITVFVEVKTRTSGIFGGAVSAISSQKIKLLKKAITAYSVEKYISLAEIRLDFIAIDINKNTKKIKINHFLDIF